jgi:transposase InsO family protein
MKVIAAVTAFVAGESVNVSRVCEGSGTSRKTFYKWAARYREEGLAGLEERSSRPRHSPQRTDAGIEALVVELRAELETAGLDHGATTVQWHLGRDPRMRGRRVPSVATIHRMLVRHGLVVAQPRKRPRSTWKRFEAAAANEWWQMDSTDWVIATGLVKIFNVVDDHSRVVIRSRAVEEGTSNEAWTTFCQGAQRWGLPAGLLSDNGLCFSGKLRGFEVLFEANLRDAGVRPITGRPFHPQTTGKVERFQQTLKKWLRHQSLARSLAELQAQLDQFCHRYNHDRPHQGIGRVTPISRWQAATKAGPSGPLEHPTFPKPVVRTAAVSNQGHLGVDDLQIQIGAPYAGATATVIIDGTYASVYVHDHLVRHLKLDHNRRYQPSGKRRGGPRQPRVAS